MYTPIALYPLFIIIEIWWYIYIYTMSLWYVTRHHSNTRRNDQGPQAATLEAALVNLGFLLWCCGDPQKWSLIDHWWIIDHPWYSMVNLAWFFQCSNLWLFGLCFMASLCKERWKAAVHAEQLPPGRIVDIPTPRNPVILKRANNKVVYLNK